MILEHTYRKVNAYVNWLAKFGVRHHDSSMIWEQAPSEIAFQLLSNATRVEVLRA